MDSLQAIVEPYDRIGRCPHALGALRWVSAMRIRCSHCGQEFTLAPFGSGARRQVS
jgi:hypothetical protein